MKQFSAAAALVAALAFSTSALAIDVTVNAGGSAGASAGASASSPAGNAGVTGSIGAGAGGGAAASVNPGAAGAGAGVTANATGGAGGADSTNPPSCVAFNTSIATSDAEIAAIKALAGNGKVIVYQLDASSCPQVRNVTTADAGKLQAAINANAQLVADLKAKKIEVGNVVAASVASDGTISFYTMG